MPFYEGKIRNNYRLFMLESDSWALILQSICLRKKTRSFSAVCSRIIWEMN